MLGDRKGDEPRVSAAGVSAGTLGRCRNGAPQRLLSRERGDVRCDRSCSGAGVSSPKPEPAFQRQLFRLVVPWRPRERSDAFLPVGALQRMLGEGKYCGGG